MIYALSALVLICAALFWFSCANSSLISRMEERYELKRKMEEK